MSAADQIRALVDSGTPGPWHRNRDWIDAGEYDEVLAPAPVDCMAYCYGGSSRIELSDADAAKIVAFVNARPTLCRLTRFDTRDPHTGSVLLPADLPGWSMGGGVSGPGVEQIECPDCYSRLGGLVSLTRVFPPGNGGAS